MPTAQRMTVEDAFQKKELSQQSKHHRDQQQQQGQHHPTKANSQLVSSKQDNGDAGKPASPMTFQKFSELYPERAKNCLVQLQEVTNISDDKLLTEALNKAHSKNKGDNYDESIAEAIELILEWQASSKQSKQVQNLRNAENVQTKTVRPNTTNSGQNQYRTMPPAVAFGPNGSRNALPSNPPNSPNHSNTNPLVDLTDGSALENKDTSDAELQRAIKLSLQDVGGSHSFGNQITQEDQDMSRAVEASLFESASSGRSNAINWIDPLNPHDRERHGLWPVGLKNVGQTCWFSAVIQSLFYLPTFRNMVIQFEPPPSNLNAMNDTDFAKKIEFILELRKLFALLLATQRKYVDPSNALQLLRGTIGASNANHNENQQEDVSEFTHILLAWLEDIWKKSAGSSTTTEEQMDQGELPAKEGSAEAGTPLHETASHENPISKLFFGRIKVDRMEVQKTTSYHEQFTQYSLQVKNFVDIHESLENSTANESLNSAASLQRWFIDLPPVLLFSLSRFEFDVTKGNAEKIHNRFEFPDVLYMDRYMHSNRKLTLAKREEVKILKAKLDELNKDLEQFTSYGSGEEKVSLETNLQYTIDYATSCMDVRDSSSNSPSKSTVAESTPSSVSHVVSASQMQVDSPCPSPQMTPSNSVSNIPVEIATEQTESGCKTKEGESFQCESTDVEMTEVGCEKKKSAKESEEMDKLPRPKYASAQELQSLLACLERWKKEVSSKVDFLKSSIREIKSTLEGIYSDPFPNNLEYRLHAVLVHEGSVNSGHYWAYVYHQSKQKWLKFNDNSVTESSWQDLIKDSYGGYSNASAYSLVYLEASQTNMLLNDEVSEQTDFLSDSSKQDGISSILLNLPKDLAEYVACDNVAFKEECDRWDAEQIRKKEQKLQAEKAAMSEGLSNDLEVVEERLTYVNTHAKLSMKQSVELLQRVDATISSEGAKKTVDKLLQLAFKNYDEYCNGAYEEDVALGDKRLESFIIYLFKNKCKISVLKLALLEQFSLPELHNQTLNSGVVQNQTQLTLKAARAEDPQSAATLKHWHQAYHLYRLSAHCFVKGVHAFINSSFEESLDLFTACYVFCIRIMERPPKGNFKTLRVNPILKYLCHSLSAVNQHVIKSFRQSEKVKEVREKVSRLIVPVVYLLQERVKRETKAKEENCSPTVHNQGGGITSNTLEEVRGEWCKLLGEDEGISQQELEEILSDILESKEPKDWDSRLKNLTIFNQQEDLCLASSYSDALKRTEAFR